MDIGKILTMVQERQIWDTATQTPWCKWEETQVMATNQLLDLECKPPPPNLLSHLPFPQLNSSTPAGHVSSLFQDGLISCSPNKIFPLQTLLSNPNSPKGAAFPPWLFLPLLIVVHNMLHCD